MIRKIRRNMIKVEGKKKSYRPTEYLRGMWEKYQIAKYGDKIRAWCSYAKTGKGHRYVGARVAGKLCRGGI